MAKLALALLAAPAVAFVAPGQQAASKVVVKGDIGVDPGPIDPSGPFWDDQEGLARRRAVEIKHGRISMMAFLGMMVQELGITFPGSINLDGSVQFSDILKDGMGFPAVANIPTFGLFQIVAFAGFAEIGAMPAAQYTGGPQNLPGGYDGRRHHPRRLPVHDADRGRHGAQPRPHVRAPERPRGHARHVRRHVPLVRRLVRPPLLLPDHAQLSVLAKKNKEALDSELGGLPLTDARLCKGLTNI